MTSGPWLTWSSAPKSSCAALSRLMRPTWPLRRRKPPHGLSPGSSITWISQGPSRSWPVPAFRSWTIDYGQVSMPGLTLFLNKRAHTEADRLAVLVIGAATDLASGLLADPALGNRIEIMAMAFDAWPDGGDSFNVGNDLTAWRTLLGSGAPIAVGDAALTTEQAPGWPGEAGPAGNYLVGLLRAWIDAHPELLRRITGNAAAWPVWDQAAVAHLLGMTTSETRPRPRVRDDFRFDHPALTDREITWITRIDADRPWADLQRKLQTLSAPPA